MKFNVLSTERHHTAVKITPNHHDGSFAAMDRWSATAFEAADVLLLGIRRRDAIALRSGNLAVMDKYLTTVPNRPDIIEFTGKCRSLVPDPLAPDAGYIGVRKVIELAPMIDVQMDAQPILHVES